MVVVRQCHAFSNQCNTERRYRSVLSCVQPIVLGVSLFSTAAFFSVGRHVRQRSAKGHLSEKSLPSGSLNISSLVFGEASGGRYLTWKRKVKVQHHRHTARTVTTRDDMVTAKQRVKLRTGNQAVASVPPIPAHSVQFTMVSTRSWMPIRARTRLSELVSSSILTFCQPSGPPDSQEILTMMMMMMIITYLRLFSYERKTLTLYRNL